MILKDFFPFLIKLLYITNLLTMYIIKSHVNSINLSTVLSLTYYRFVLTFFSINIIFVY